MKAATAAVSSGSSQKEDSRAQTPTQQCSTTDESRIDVEAEEGDESRSSTAPNTRRRIVTKVTTQESLDGIREKAMRIASLDKLGASSSAGRWSSSVEAENDRTKKANELVRAFVGSTMKEGDMDVACDSKSKLWRDLSWQRARQNWNMKYVDVARSPGSWKIGDEERDV